MGNTAAVLPLLIYIFFSLILGEAEIKVVMGFREGTAWGALGSSAWCKGARVLGGPGSTSHPLALRS